MDARHIARPHARKRSRHREHLRLGSLELWSHQRVMIGDSLTIFDVAGGAAFQLGRLMHDSDWLNRTVIDSGSAPICLHHPTLYKTYPDKRYWYRNKVPINGPARRAE
ncbi:uncharacterized protein ARMOST_21072 [Armillaria ostoyae]|uniref:Uncharacterized protein n=1 Tax=Armillaria ostoyae TaxID=47428 RepID=A0A284S956_ARMOS|nr:uncharacterized protein ARMOST_21072 [Armillaria ostoyae]